MMMPTHSRRPINSPERVGVSLGNTLQVVVHPLHQAGSHFGVDAAYVVQVCQAQAPDSAGGNRTIGARPAARQGLFLGTHWYDLPPDPTTNYTGHKVGL